MSLHSAIAIIPARGGSKGLPGKNVRLLAGLPLIAHSIRFARLCPEIERCIVSTDSEEIAKAAETASSTVRVDVLSTDRSEVAIGQWKIGPNHPCFVIAEAGVNH